MLNMVLINRYTDHLLILLQGRKFCSFSVPHCVDHNENMQRTMAVC